MKKRERFGESLQDVRMREGVVVLFPIRFRFGNEDEGREKKKC